MEPPAVSPVLLVHAGIIRGPAGARAQDRFLVVFQAVERDGPTAVEQGEGLGGEGPTVLPGRFCEITRPEQQQQHAALVGGDGVEAWCVAGRKNRDFLARSERGFGVGGTHHTLHGELAEVGATVGLCGHQGCGFDHGCSAVEETLEARRRVAVQRGTGGDGCQSEDRQQTQEQNGHNR